MDIIAKLDKMKVVDLRNELQSRGLDSKGVKAVLVERLRACIEGGSSSNGGSDAVPGELPLTPSRRRRRTRSMTKSPSPSPVKKPEPSLETLAEEDGQQEDIERETPSEEMQEQEVEDVEDVEDVELPLEDENMSEEADEPQKEADEADSEVAEDRSAENENSVECNVQEEEDSNETKAQEQMSESNEANEDKESDKHVEEDEELEGKEEKTVANELNESMKDVDKNDEEDKSAVDDKSEAEAVVEKDKESRNRSHSRSRSRSRSPSASKERDNRSRSRSRSPKRRSGAGSHASPSKAADEAANPEDEPTIEDKQFGLSWYDSDLHLRIDPVTFTSAKPLINDVYSLVWSGVRTNYGVREGKVAFEVRIADETPLGRSHNFRDEPFIHGFRVGFSMPNAPLLLGEAENSFAYCETGRKANNSEFVDYARPYKLDDVIGCYLDLDSEPSNIRYTLNGEDLGVAFEFDKSILGETDALYPHVVTKGYEFHVNFADNDNLLVNVERKTRKRRKQRKIEKVIENEKSDETKEEEKSLSESTSSNIEKKEDVNADGDDTAVDGAAAVDDGDDEEKTAINETDKKEAMEETKMEVDDVENPSAEKDPENKDEDKEKSETPTDSANGETKESDEKTKDDGDNELDADEKVKDKDKDATDETTKKSDSDNDNSGPSPNKRVRLSSDHKQQRNRRDSSKVESESEYEDVEPESREQMQLLPDYELIALIPEEQYIAGPQRPESRKECEVIILVGLPGSGKTQWTLKHLAEQPEKRFHVIGADALIAKMTVDGKPRKEVHKGRWDKVYEQSLSSLSSLEDIATKRRRNFILDQTNAYASVQRRKMKGFGDFKRIAVVCIPNDDELDRRIADKKEKGNAFAIRDSTLNNLRANFTLPSLEFGWFDEIIYTDLNGDEAKEVVKKYNEKGKKAIEASQSNRDKRNRRDNYRRDDHRRRYDDRRRTGGGGGGGGGGSSGSDYRHKDQRWNDRRQSGGYHQVGGSRWGNAVPVGGGGGAGYGGGHGHGHHGHGAPGGAGGYRGGPAWRDERGYSGGGGGGGSAAGGPRGYDNRNHRYGSGNAAPQNWAQNQRNRYDDRYQRSSTGGSSGGGGVGRYDGGSGGGGAGRDYRERDRGGGNDRNRNSSYRSGGASHQQRDFRHGHRDTHVDSRGGYDKSAMKFNNNTSKSGYEQQSADKTDEKSQSGKWAVYSQQQQQPQPQHQQSGGSNWQQYHQSAAAQLHQQHQQQQQQYWDYNQAQGYANQQHQQQQHQWQAADPSQQQQWMSWWQQQQQGTQQIPVSAEGNQYWSQYSYSTATTDPASANVSGVGGVGGSGGTTNATKN